MNLIMGSALLYSRSRRQSSLSEGLAGFGFDVKTVHSYHELELCEPDCHSLLVAVIEAADLSRYKSRADQVRRRCPDMSMVFVAPDFALESIRSWPVTDLLVLAHSLSEAELLVRVGCFYVQSRLVDHNGFRHNALTANDLWLAILSKRSRSPGHTTD